MPHRTVAAMQLRIFTEPQQGAYYDDLLRVARAAEDLGFDAFFRSDHYLKMGDVSGQPGPTDAWITLAGLARDTRTIRLGTLVTSMTFRWPGPLAVSVAQVDEMSGGRVELGLGAGWFENEHKAYGIPFPGSVAERFDRLEEQLEIITGLWATPGLVFVPGSSLHDRVDHPVFRNPCSGPGRQSSSVVGASSARRASPPDSPPSTTCRSRPSTTSVSSPSESGPPVRRSAATPLR